MGQLEKLKVLLGLPDVLDARQEVLLGFVLDEARDFICRYCRVEVVPVGLENVLLAMAVEGYRQQQLGSDVVLGDVKEIVEGRVRMSFDGSSSVAGERLRAVWRSYVVQLDGFRKAGWQCGGQYEDVSNGQA